MSLSNVKARNSVSQDRILKRKQQPKKYICKECSKKFPTSQAYAGHCKGHMKKTSNTSEIPQSQTNVKLSISPKQKKTYRGKQTNLQLSIPVESPVKMVTRKCSNTRIRWDDYLIKLAEAEKCTSERESLNIPYLIFVYEDIV